MDCNGLERRCPRLGGPVAFGYCRNCGDDGRPCFKILDCWWESFDVAAVMTAQIGTAGVEELRRSRPQAKITSLLDLIARAKERIDGA